MKKIIHSSNAPEAIGPYSQAVFANNTLYCSGQIALDKNGVLVNGNISDETNQIINNIREVYPLISIISISILIWFYLNSKILLLQKKLSY